MPFAAQAPSILRNSIGKAKVIERALRQHAKRTTAAQHSSCHRVDRTVAASSHYHAVLVLSQCYRFGAHTGDAGWIVELLKLKYPAWAVKDVGQNLALFMAVFVARCRVQDHEEWAVAGSRLS